MFYNPRVSEKCDEPNAEHPREMERANFCDYFKPKPGAFVARDETRTRLAKGQLDALFGKAPGESTPSKADAAHTKLEELFGSGDKEDNKRE